MLVSDENDGSIDVGFPLEVELASIELKGKVRYVEFANAVKNMNLNEFAFSPITFVIQGVKTIGHIAGFASKESIVYEVNKLMNKAEGKRK
jgi:hypothetical protein